MVHRGPDTIDLVHQDELAGAKLPRLGFLILRRAEHDNLRSHLRGKLNREVPKPPDAHNAHPIRAPHRRHKRPVHRRARALQRCGVLGAQRVGYLVDVGLAADVELSKGAIAVVALAEHDALGAVDVAAGEAVAAGAARRAVEAAAGAVADAQRRHRAAHSDDGADALVAQRQRRARPEELPVREAHARVRDPQQDVVRAQRGDGGGRGGDGAVEAAVHGVLFAFEFGGHCLRGGSFVVRAGCAGLRWLAGWAVSWSVPCRLYMLRTYSKHSKCAWPEQVEVRSD